MTTGSTLAYLDARMAQEDHPKPKVNMPGPFPGTPDKAYITNVCRSGYHENLVEGHQGECKGAGWMGKGRKWVCKCSCHTTARKLAPGTDFDPPVVEHDPLRITLSDELRMWRESQGIDARPARESTVTDSTFHEETGKRARGALEKQVDLICRAYAKGGLDSLETRDELPEDAALLTPKIIAREIEFVYGQEAPSEGAIRAAFYRWRDIGYAFISEKPLGFMLLTPLGIELGLERCKERAR